MTSHRSAPAPSQPSAYPPLPSVSHTHPQEPTSSYQQGPSTEWSGPGHFSLNTFQEGEPEGRSQADVVQLHGNPETSGPLLKEFHAGRSRAPLSFMRGPKHTREGEREEKKG